jgi:hypothetical protein
MTIFSIEFSDRETISIECKQWQMNSILPLNNSSSDLSAMECAMKTIIRQAYQAIHLMTFW